MRPCRRNLILVAALLIGATCLFPAAEARPVNDLPGARGRSFDTLDAYLTFLKERGVSDHAFYQLQPDGRYLHVRGRGTMNDQHNFTREQLLEKFGFAQ